jgi:hypothetical protein
MLMPVTFIVEKPIYKGMVERIVVGRDPADLAKFGERGTVFIGKHVVGKGEDAHLTNPVMMDVIRPHIVLICGKRGSGKSYSAAVIAEEIIALPEEIRKNLSVIMIDTMGIYWSMKKPNDKEADALREWGLKPAAMKSMRFFIPKGFAGEYEAAGIEYDATFTLPCSEMSASDWTTTFGFSSMDDYGMATERAVKAARKRLEKYSIEDILKEVESDARTEKKVKDALYGRFSAAQDWGVFEKEGTPPEKFMQPGATTVIDISHYVRDSSGWSVRSMVIGLLSRKIFQARLMARKSEEVETITGEQKSSMPLVWMMIDEAHQFIPAEGATAASEPILTLIKEGREPGVSLVLITQIPNKLHPDALAQADLVIAHRLTSDADISALQAIMQTYALDDIRTLVNTLPREKGAAVLLDDNSERIYAIQVRPRLSWHAGGSPKAIKEKGLFD